MYDKKWDGWLKHSDFILWELLCIQASFFLAFLFRNGWGNPYAQPLHRNMACFYLLADIAVIFFQESFQDVMKREPPRELWVTTQHGVWIQLLAALYLFSIQEGGSYSRLMLYYMGAIHVALGYSVRLAWKQAIKKKAGKQAKQSVLLITESSQAEKTLRRLQESSYEGYQISGLVLTDRDGTGETINHVPVVASIEDVSQYLCHEWVDEVFLDMAPQSPLFRGIVEGIQKTGVAMHLNLERLIERSSRKKFTERYGSYTVLTTSMNYMTPKESLFKRALDIAGGLVGCMLTVVLFLFLAPVIYIQSPGPIFFSQTRIGKNGKPFRIYKFRSMYLDAEERKKELMKYNRVQDNRMFKMDFDPRIIGNKILPDGSRKTGIGEFIRRNSLDEFPQFWNVLKGDMSLVGTRPPLPQEVNAYLEGHRARLAVKPGITGMWQISGRSEITDFEEVVRLDTQYINEWSMWLDIKILLKTVKVVFTKEGSM